MDFYNLSRGILCPHYRNDGVERFTRIQSTSCEQKQWNTILVTLPPDFYVYAALSHPIIVHDQSERNRETRAMWQGLSWIRWALDRAWWKRWREERIGKNATVMVSRYWNEQFNLLPSSTRRLLDYYGGYAGMSGSVSIESCWRKEER